jgi:predicted dehydrogenase
MRVALFGDHPGGLNVARALAASGRHEVSAYAGPPEGLAALNDVGLRPRAFGDLEEILADPAVEAVVVASRPVVRAAQLRRALQSERHVLCVHPVEPTPEAAYEAAMLQSDTGRVLLPILTEALHPAVARLAEWTRSEREVLGPVQLIAMERQVPAVPLGPAGGGRSRITVPGWDVLRLLGGDVAEVFAVAPGDEPAPQDAALLAGRFKSGALWQMALLPGHAEPAQRWNVVGTRGRAELLFSDGWPGPARLRLRDAQAVVREETWDAWDPGAAVVNVFDAAVAEWMAAGKAPSDRPPMAWADAVRSLELDDAAARSLRYHRGSTLEYPEASEEVGFKGTMTLVGCALLCGAIVLLVLSRWLPWLGWGILPLLLVFLVLQTLRWALPRAKGANDGRRSAGGPGDAGPPRP